MRQVALSTFLLIALSSTSLCADEPTPIALTDAELRTSLKAVQTKHRGAFFEGKIVARRNTWEGRSAVFDREKYMELEIGGPDDLEGKGFAARCFTWDATGKILTRQNVWWDGSTVTVDGYRKLENGTGEGEYVADPVDETLMNNAWAKIIFFPANVSRVVAAVLHGKHSDIDALSVEGEILSYDLPGKNVDPLKGDAFGNQEYHFKTKDLGYWKLVVGTEKGTNRLLSITATGPYEKVTDDRRVPNLERHVVLFQDKGSIPMTPPQR